MESLALVSDPASETTATTMKAVVQEEYGSPDKLELRDVDKPVVDDDGVLVRVRAAAVNALDWRVMRGLPYLVRLSEGRRRPENPIRGVDLAGHVEAVGKNVTEFKPGDEVFGERSRAFAEYVLGKEEHFAHRPASLTFEQAATLGCAALTALQGLRDKAQVKPGQKVLINGGGGGVGTFSVQIAKAFGADVTAVCHTHNVEMVGSIGADRVIDYTKEDLTRNAQKYDLIFELAGTTSPRAYRRLLTAKGRLVLSSGESPGRLIGPFDRIVKAVLLSPFVGQTLRPLSAKVRSEDLQFLTELVEAGTVTPVIDRTYPLSETPDAIRYLETGHARGKITIAVSPARTPASAAGAG
jgi:NADPH:quinone reductase-like Zn-dependent oxidoreductase